MREMMQQAQAMGANAVVGIDIDYENWRQRFDAHGRSQWNSRGDLSIS